MKYIVKDNQIGFVMKNGRFVKTVGAGKYNYSSLLGYTVKVEIMEDELKFDEVPFEILMKDSNFAAKVKRFVIPDGEVGFIYRNGSLVNCAKKNEYIFWNVFEENETLFQLKKLEYLERICNRVGEVSVSNGGNVLEQLSKMML